VTRRTRRERAPARAICFAYPVEDSAPFRLPTEIALLAPQFPRGEGTPRAGEESNSAEAVVDFHAIAPFPSLNAYTVWS